SPMHFNFARDVMEDWAQRRPEATALWWTDETGRQEQKISFAQLRQEFVRASSFFHQLGIQRGDRVLVILPRIPQWWVALLGLIRMGAVPIPGTPQLTPKDIRYRVETAGVSAVITDTDGANKLEGIPVGHKILVGEPRAGWVDFDAGLRDADPGFAPEPTRGDEPGILFFTSGTTGPPKMVLHTQA